MEIDYIKGPKTSKIFGMSRYENEIHKRIKNVDFNVIEYKSLTHAFEKKYKSLVPPKNNHSHSNLKSNKTTSNNIINSLINTGKNITNDIDRYRYANLVKNKIKEDNVKHITYQDLAYLLNSVKLKKSILTCHDLIPWAYEKNRSSFWKNNLIGLKKADKIITVSEFSKNEIIKYAKYPKDKISVIPNAVDHSIYYKNPNKDILNKLNIGENEQIILYVGSEEPRQKVDILIKSFAKLKKKLPKIKLIKIGDSNLYGAREKLLKLIEDLNLKKDVIFIGYVPDDELPEWYNAADLFVYPCAYAGFGLPPLEAMACGTPIITSNTTSLPEVMGNAGIMINPNNIEDLSENMYEILTNGSLREDLISKGLKRAKMFNWDESAEKTFEVYNELDELI
ncbi:MAG: glycosyltransferase family 4 protein [Methanobacterium sp.]|uniref:glycosyltransferase family 4 protein n=1 Tax=Methanobacterium sp. TaxID=2164 RepID=UPI003D65279A|nr:glycosyltransferase family 4 protein [Methanobacterium sp.]